MNLKFVRYVKEIKRNDILSTPIQLFERQTVYDNVVKSKYIHGKNKIIKNREKKIKKFKRLNAALNTRT